MTGVVECPSSLIGQDSENLKQLTLPLEHKNSHVQEELVNSLTLAQTVEWLRVLEERVDDLETRLAKYDVWDDHK